MDCYHKETPIPYWGAASGKKKAEWSEPDTDVEEELEEEIPGAAGHPHRTDEASDDECSYTDTDVATSYQSIEPNILQLALKRLRADYFAYRSNDRLKEQTKQKHMNRIAADMKILEARLKHLQKLA